MKTQLVASECYAGLFPQNTLMGFKSCLELGVDGIECDVHLSRDGHVIVQHDYRLNPRVTRERNGSWLGQTGAAVCDLTLAELQQFDVGRYAPESREAKSYPDYQPADQEPIPTLESFADAYLGAQSEATLWLELKTSPFDRNISSDPDRLLRRVLEIVETNNLVANTVLLAFEWDLLLAAKTQCPEIGTDFLTINEAYTRSIYRNRPDTNPADLYSRFDPRDFGGNIAAAIAAAGGDWWGPYDKDVDAADVADAQARGVKVNIWGGDMDSASVQHALTLGADALTISDLRMAHRSES